MNGRGAVWASCLALASAACHSLGGAREVLPPEDEQWVAREAIERGDVKVVEARSRAVEEPIATGGRIAFDDERVTHVFSPVTGRVTRVVAQLGQPVKKGNALAGSP
jgi:cobalt-zinc-cadmium efflux system membrane fusion protein